MRTLHTLNSIDNNENISWDKVACTLITEKRSYGIASSSKLDSVIERDIHFFAVVFP